MRLDRYIIAALMLLMAVSACAEVTVVRTYPANGARNIDPRIGTVRVRFSEPISVNPPGYAFMDTDTGAPLPTVGLPVLTEDNKVCAYAVRLEPGTAYAVDIYSATVLKSGTSTARYPLRFKTSGKPRVKPAMTAQEWQADLSYIGAALPKLHKNLFAKMTEADWNQNVQKLHDRIPTMTEAEILVGLNNLIASIGDPHTTINILGSDKLSVIPMLAYSFKDGVFIVTASDRSKLGAQILKVGDIEVDKACDALSGTFAHDNQSACRLLAPMFLTAPDFLKSVGLVQKIDEVALTLKDQQGKTTTVAVRSLKNGSVHDLKSVTDGTKAAVPLYRKHPEIPYWTEYVDNGKLVYFQYNKCQDDPDQPFKSVRSEVEKLLGEHKDARLVIDMRNNGGGNSAVLDPFIDWVKANPDLNSKGRVFVITGRRTFSSAILNTISLRNWCGAILVGEPTGASPNGYGEVQRFNLANSGLRVSYSTKYFREAREDMDAVAPDVVIEPTFAQFVSGQDPVLDAIVDYRRG